MLVVASRPYMMRDTKDPRRAAWSAEITARPAHLVARVLSRQSTSSVRGEFFILNSTAFS